MLAANHVDETRGIGADDNALEVVWADGGTSLPRAAKPDLAKALVACIAARYHARMQA
jgi:phosphopantothenoylcysteine decarboxylase/phosphopantothenate--cysteine ligase